MRLFAWLGGTLFVTALAVTAWIYAVLLARVVPFAGWPTVWLDAVLFSCFALHHTLFARDRVKRTIGRMVPPDSMRSVYVWTASILLIAVDLNWRPVGGSIYQMSQPAATVALAVQLVGMWLTVRGALTIHPLELAGIRNSTGPATLQVGGPYRLVRHPLYLGWMLMVFGAAHMTGDRLTFAAVSTGYLAIAIPFEERSLIRVFGPQYERYRHRVRWRMVPFVY